jgi:hypothetical protein
MPRTCTPCLPLPSFVSSSARPAPQFYIEEGRGNVDYLGYIKPKYGRDAADDEDRLISAAFSWKGEEKNVSTFFVGACGRRAGAPEWASEEVPNHEPTARTWLR